jgi:hypothetical protein
VDTYFSVLEINLFIQNPPEEGVSVTVPIDCTNFRVPLSPSGFICRWADLLFGRIFLLGYRGEIDNPLEHLLLAGYYFSQIAGVTQLVECNLAKVDVEGSNPFARSNEVRAGRIHYAGGENWMARGVVYGAQSLRLIQTQSYLGLNE